MIMHIFSIISRVQFKYTEMADITKNLLGNDTCLCITYAESKKAADCAIYCKCDWYNFQVAFHNVCSLVRWILYNSSGPFLNFPNRYFIFTLQVHHNLRELFGFIVAYLLQTFTWNIPHYQSQIAANVSKYITEKGKMHQDKSDTIQLGNCWTPSRDTQTRIRNMLEVLRSNALPKKYINPLEKCCFESLISLRQ